MQLVYSNSMPWMSPSYTVKYLLFDWILFSIPIKFAEKKSSPIISQARIINY